MSEVIVTDEEMVWLEHIEAHGDDQLTRPETPEEREALARLWLHGYFEHGVATDYRLSKKGEEYLAIGRRRKG